MAGRLQARAAGRANRVGAALLLLVALSQGLSLVQRAFPMGAWLRVLVPLVTLAPPMLVLGLPGEGRPRGAGRLPLLPLLLVLPPVFVALNALASWGQRLLGGLLGLGAPAPAALPAGLWPRAAFILASCVLAPLLEELFFRGGVLPALAPWGGHRAVVAGALLFTLLHASPAELPTVFVIGVLLGYVALFGGSALPCVLLHALNNLSAVALMAAREVLPPNDRQPAAVLATALLALSFFCGCLLWKRRYSGPGPAALWRGVPPARNGLLRKAPVYAAGCLVVGLQFVLGVFF